MRRLVEFESPRAAPPAVLERLREVDPATELVYLGRGLWALGSVAPHRERRARAVQMIERQRALPPERRNAGTVRYAKLLAQGFRVVDIYDEAQVESGYVVRDYRFRDWRYRNEAEEAFAERAREAEGADELERRILAALDIGESEFGSLFDHVMAGRRHVS